MKYKIPIWKIYEKKALKVYEEHVENFVFWFKSFKEDSFFKKVGLEIKKSYLVCIDYPDYVVRIDFIVKNLNYQLLLSKTGIITIDSISGKLLIVSTKKEFKKQFKVYFYDLLKK